MYPRCKYHADIYIQAIVAKVEPGEERVNIYLYDDWYQTDIRIGTITIISSLIQNHHTLE